MVDVHPNWYVTMISSPMFTHLCLWDVDPYVFDQGFMQPIAGASASRHWAIGEINGELRNHGLPLQVSFFFLVYLPHQYEILC